MLMPFGDGRFHADRRSSSCGRSGDASPPLLDMRRNSPRRESVTILKLTASAAAQPVIRSALTRRVGRRPVRRAARLGRRRAPVVMPAIIIGLLLTGCAAQMPTQLRTTVAALTVAAAREAPAQHTGARVRWGGSILAVRNAADRTDIEVLAQPLDAAGRPQPDAPAAADAYGRFIARFAGFLDPAQYPQGRLLTVTGTLTGVETRDVGDYPYRYPVVAATAKHLWPEPTAPADRPWYPDPWLGPPWPGFGPYPWYRDPWYRPWYW
jgi:outer membrane lipoprotein